MPDSSPNPPASPSDDSAAGGSRDNPGSGGADGPKDPMPLPLVIVVAVYVIAMFFFVLYYLIAVWPSAAPAPSSDIRFLFWEHLRPRMEIRLILLAALAGALGAYVHLTTSFVDYAGNRRLTLSWLWWYILRPFVGMALALIFYLVLRAGLLNAAGGGGTSAESAINPFGVAASGALAGLFSKQATDKLREVFETIFRTQEKVDRSDPLPKPPTPPAGAGQPKP